MHTCVSVYVCVYEERERISVTLVTTAAQGCASDLYMRARVLACWYYFANLSTVSVGLPVHTVTQKNSHTHISNTKNTDKCIARNDGKSTLDTCIKEKQRVRQTAARYTQKNKQKKSK